MATIFCCRTADRNNAPEFQFLKLNCTLTKFDYVRVKPKDIKTSIPEFGNTLILNQDRPFYHLQ